MLMTYDVSYDCKSSEFIAWLHGMLTPGGIISTR
ncbi:MAG: hypothetical protein ACI90V_001743 [Bacillariaceae sp.]|jgi:hypothetical protein